MANYIVLSLSILLIVSINSSFLPYICTKFIPSYPLYCVHQITGFFFDAESIVCVLAIYINHINGEENASCITTLSTAALLLISFDSFINASNGNENAPTLVSSLHCMALVCIDSIVAMAGSGLFLDGMIDHRPLIKLNSIS
eukprot:842933_1